MELSGSGRRSAGRRFRLIDSMRGLAALSVVLYHVAFRFPPPRSTVSFYLTERSAGPPITAVVLFFLISGFVLYRPFVAARFEHRAPPSLLPYAARRFARIVPGYWVALALVSAWLGYGYMLHPTGLIRYFGFLQLYGDNRTVSGGIGVAWSLCVEVTFYTALPLLAWTARRLARRRPEIIRSELTLLAAMVLVSLVWQLAFCTLMNYDGGWQVSLLSALPGALDLFAAGMLLAVLSVEREHRPVKRSLVSFAADHPWPWWLAAAAVLYAEGRIPGSAGITAWWLSTHALKLIACWLLLAPMVFGESHAGLGHRILGSRPFLWLGTISYGIYLWHYPVLEKLSPHLVPHGELYTTVAVAVISAGLATLSYLLVEQPAQRLARRWIAIRRARSAASAAASRAPA